MQKASPDWCHHQLHHRLESFFSFLAEFRQRSSFFFDAIFSLILILFFGLSWTALHSAYMQQLLISDTARTVFRFYEVLPLIGTLVVLAGVFLTGVSGKKYFLGWIFLSLLSPFFLIFFREQRVSHELFLALAFTFAAYVFYLVLLAATRKWQSLPRLLFLLAASLAIYVFSEWIDIHSEQSLKAFWYLHPTRWLFVFSYLVLEESSGLIDSRGSNMALTSFTQFVFPIPLRSRQMAARANSLALPRVRGAFDLISSLCIGFIGFFFDFLRTQTSSTGLALGFLLYIYVFCISYSYITFFVGCLRWIGYDLPSAYDLPLLAANPLDRWRRWNTYFYHWLYTVIFFPSFKKTKSLIFSLGLIYVAVCFIHLSRYSIIFFRGAVHSNFLKLAAFFFAHFVVIAIAFVFKSYWPSGNKISGWIGVALTWLFMCGVHLLIYF